MVLSSKKNTIQEQFLDSKEVTTCQQRHQLKLLLCFWEFLRVDRADENKGVKTLKWEGMERSAADETMGSADCRIIFTPHTVETKRFFSPSVLSLHHVYSLQGHLFVRSLSFEEYLCTSRSVPQHKFPLFQQEWRMVMTMPRSRFWCPMFKMYRFSPFKKLNKCCLHTEEWNRMQASWEAFYAFSFYDLYTAS